MCLAYYDTALHIARDSRDVVLYMDIAIQKASYNGAYDSLRVYRLCRLSVDSMHNPHYAPVVAEYLIAHDRLQEASPYMAMLARDTVGSKWHAQQYKYLKSWWDAKTGDAAKAYDVLQSIYRDQSEQIADRIELAKRVNQSAPASKKPLPSWLRPYINRYSLATDASWKAFLREFNTAYSGFIPYIHAHYPALTDADIQYIILLTLGFNNSDIAFVLDRTDRTIWNRRNTICVRLGDAHMTLDEWVDQLREDYIHSRLGTAKNT